MQGNQVVQNNLSSKLLNSHNLFGRIFGLLYLFLVIFQTRKLIVSFILFMLLLHCRSGGLKAMALGVRRRRLLK